VLVALTSSSLADRADREIVVETPGERTLTNKLVVGGILATGLAVGGLGVYWHLDSRAAADEVSAEGPTGKAWSPSDIDLVDRADRSRSRATIAYGIGGAIVIAGIITFIATEPASETTVIRARQIIPRISPVPGGAIVGSGWSF
jgi:hypothetical protein